MSAPDRSYVYRGTHTALVVTLFVPRSTGHAAGVVCLEQVIKGVPDRQLEARFSIGSVEVPLSELDALRLAIRALTEAAATY